MSTLSHRPDAATPSGDKTTAPPPSTRRFDWIHGLVILLLGISSALWVAWFHGWGRLELPVSHVRGSDWDYQLTLLEATARIWSMGEVPVWNPWTAGGVPLWANPEAPVLHPMAWAATIWHPATVARVVLIVHVGLQVMGAAVLARVMGARWWALPVVAVGLLTTDVLVWRMAHGHLMMAQAAWIPWAMALGLGIRDPLRAGAACAAVIAVAVHGGGHYPAWIALASTGIWLAAWTLVRTQSSERGLRVGVLTDGISRLVTMAILTGLLTAPRWWTTASALADTPRLRGPQAPHAMGAFTPLEGMVQMFSSGWSPEHTPPGLHEGLPDMGTPLFLVLAACALIRVSGPRLQRRLSATAVAVLGVYLAVSFGNNFPGNAYAWLHAIAPLNRFRNPERWGMAWVPVLCALGAVGTSQVIGASSRRSVRGVLALGIIILLLWHGQMSLEATRLHTEIDQITTDTYVRTPRVPPIAVRDPDFTNFEGAGRNEACLACSDALLHEAPPELREGPFSLDAPAQLVHWQPDLVRFTVAVDPAADPRAPMVTEVVVPQAHRVGWSATDETGLNLRVTTDPAGTRVRVPTPGRVVTLRYIPPGWTRARQLGWLGVILWLALIGPIRLRWAPRRAPAM